MTLAVILRRATLAVILRRATLVVIQRRAERMGPGGHPAARGAPAEHADRIAFQPRQFPAVVRRRSVPARDALNELITDNNELDEQLRTGRPLASRREPTKGVPGFVRCCPSSSSLFVIKLVSASRAGMLLWRTRAGTALAGERSYRRASLALRAPQDDRRGRSPQGDAPTP